jgi:DNA-binding NarL/FixJ family response regulator
MIHVAIVDDHAVVRAGLNAVFKTAQGIRVVGTFEHGRSFLSGLARLNRVDVVMLDISMPGADGFDVLRRLSVRREPPRVILLSMHPAHMHAQHAQELGAHGYVTKDASDETLIDAVRTVAWGGMYFGATDVEPVAKQGRPRGVEPQGFESLSDQEMRVMRLIYLGLSTKEIAQDLSVSPKTVSTYKSRIMDKMGVGNLIELIRHAESAGFRVA